MDARNVIVGFLVALSVLLLAQTAQCAAPSERGVAPEPPSEGLLVGSSHGDVCGAACCDDGECCENPRWQFFGEFLYFRPRNAGLEYGVVSGGPISTATRLQEGHTASLNPEYQPGFRVGFGRKLDECTTLSASYTRYENDVDDAIAVNPPLTVAPMVMHPSTADAERTWLAAAAHEAIDFDLVDLDYRQVFLCNERFSINYLLGVRYANLRQRFNSTFVNIIEDDVSTEVNFDGAGIRLGLEGERHALCWNLFVYGKAAADFLGGEFRGTYLQANVPGGTLVQTDWKEARLVSMLECELGLGWQSSGGRVRLSAGYAVNAWLNVVKTPEFIRAVQANDYHGPDKINGNGLVFDGLVTRAELRW